MKELTPERKRQLLQEYKDRKPEMGILSIRCNPTGETFLDWAKDTHAEANSHFVKLSGNSHPNKYLQQIWNEYGKAEFVLSVRQVLPYDEKKADMNYSKELEQLLLRCFEEKKDARRIRVWTKNLF